MIILNAKRESESEWNFDLKLTQDEVDYLVNTAVGALILAGQIHIEEKAEAQEVQLHAPVQETIN